MVDILKAVIILIGILVPAFLTYRSGQKKLKVEQDKKQNEDILTINAKLDVLGVTTEMLLESHAKADEERNIKKRIRKDLSDIADNIIFNVDITQDIRSLLIEGKEFTIDFALKIYFSGIRCDTRRIKQFLIFEANRINDALKDLSNHRFPTLKEVRITRNTFEQMSFVEYIKKYSNVYTHIQILVETLIRNGLDDEQFIELFEKFMDDSLKSGIEHWREFSKFEDVKKGAK